MVELTAGLAELPAGPLGTSGKTDGGEGATVGLCGVDGIVRLSETDSPVAARSLLAKTIATSKISPATIRDGNTRRTAE